MHSQAEANCTDDLAALRQRVAELERILEMTRELTSALTLDPLLSKIVETAQELTGSEGTSILLLDKKANELRFMVETNDPSGSLGGIRVPIERSIAGAILTSRQPVIVSDARSDPRFYPEVERLTGLTCRSLVGVPLQIHDRCIGVMEAINKQGGQEFTQRDVDTLTTLAAQITVALENARLYQEVSDHAERLEERVRERTAELQARNEELAAYDHTVAHDLKNPLGLVTGFAEVLAQDFRSMPDEELQRHLRTIARHGHKMRSIIDELLLFSEMRDVEVEREALDMGSLVAAAQHRLAGVIEEREAEIVLPETWPVALGYGPWVEEVWTNYLSNAIKYGGQPPQVEVGAKEHKDAQVRFWVRDNGPGISAEEQSRLFSRFTRLDQGRARGHGLGLSIVRRIVEKLGGQVAVESKLGHGSTFSFSLPARGYPDRTCARRVPTE